MPITCSPRMPLTQAGSSGAALCRPSQQCCGGLGEGAQEPFPRRRENRGRRILCRDGAPLVKERPPRCPCSQPMATNFPTSSPRSNRRVNWLILQTWRGSRPRGRAPIMRPTRRRSVRTISRLWTRTRLARHPRRTAPLQPKSFARPSDCHDLGDELPANRNLRRSRIGAERMRSWSARSSMWKSALLPSGGAAFLLALADGRPIGEAAAAGLADHPEFDLAPIWPASLARTSLGTS